MTPTEDQKKQLIRLDKVKQYDHALQVRGEIDQEKVLLYRTVIRENGGLMDGITVFAETEDAESKRWISDGFHRIEAYEHEKIEKIPVIVKIGTKSDALRFALHKNGHHGAPMTNLQKRHAASMAVEDPEVGKLTDQEIGRMIGCSASLVSSCRRGETPQEVTTKARERAAAKNTPSAPAVDRPSTQASGRRETESPAPAPVVTHERKQEEKQPTKAMILKQIQSWLDREQIDEDDVLGLMKANSGAYVFLPNPGDHITLRVVGKSGRAQIEEKVLVKEMKFDTATFRYENESAKIQVVEKE